MDKRKRRMLASVRGIVSGGDVVWRRGITPVRKQLKTAVASNTKKARNSWQKRHDLA